MSITNVKSTGCLSRWLRLGMVGAFLFALFSGASLPVAARVQDGPYLVVVEITDVTPNPVFMGQPVTIAVKVSAVDPLAGVPTGDVQVKSGQDEVCLISLDALGEGSCTLTFSFPAIVPLEAVYPGEAPFLPGVSGVVYLEVDITSAWLEVYQNDFEAPAGDEWCLIRQETTPSGRGFLGQFGNETTCLRLGYLPDSAWVSVIFDLYVIRSWNGNGTLSGRTASPDELLEESGAMGVGPDQWGLAANGLQLLYTTFANKSGYDQAFPDRFPGGANPYLSGAAEVNSLGYNYEGKPLDSAYHLSFVFARPQGALELDFTAQGLFSLVNESWGLDNIHLALAGGDVYWNYLPLLVR
jgi:hypothetical protein